MATIRDALEAIERELFIGREAELEAASGWLGSSDGAVVLDVVGHGGAGKTTLLREIARRAEKSGFEVSWVDGDRTPATVDGLLGALGAESVDEAADRLAASRSLLVLDTFERLAALRRFLLDELLPVLPRTIRVAVGGRVPLLDIAERRNGWAHLVQPIPLTGFTNEETCEYLRRRGVSDGQANEIAAATQGHPLSVSLAGDVLVQFSQSGSAAPVDWSAALTTSVRCLIEGLPDPELGEMLVAAAVVRRFDEPLLAALLGRTRIDDAFATLLSLASVRFARNGLALHDEVRAVILEDLRRNDPSRYTELRARALAHYRWRIAGATSAEEREFLNVERVALAEDSVVQTLLFGAGTSEDADGILLEPVSPDALDEVLEIEHVWHYDVVPAMGQGYEGAVYESLDHMAGMRTLLSHPEARIRIARDTSGRGLGYDLFVPLSQATWALLSEHPVIGGAVRRWVEQEAGPAQLPPTAVPDGAWCLVTQAVIAENPTPVLAALNRNIFAVVANAGAAITTASLPGHLYVLEQLGFERLPDTELHGFMAGGPMFGYVLDLRERGIDAWVEQKVLGALGPMLVQQYAGTEELQEPEAPPVTVRVLGGFEVRRDGEDVTPPPGLATRLLQIVAVTPGPVHAEVVAETLWPECAPGVGRRRLRNVLLRLREACGDVVVRHGPHLTLDDDVEVDLESWERAVLAVGDDLTETCRVVETWGGELLPSEVYEDWLEAPRERLRRLYLDLVDRAADAARRAGDAETAAGLLERAITVDRYDESRYRVLADLYAGLGRAGAAARVLARLSDALVELGLPPVAIRAEVRSERRSSQVSA